MYRGYIGLRLLRDVGPHQEGLDLLRDDVLHARVRLRELLEVEGDIGRDLGRQVAKLVHEEAQEGALLLGLGVQQLVGRADGLSEGGFSWGWGESKWVVRAPLRFP